MKEADTPKSWLSPSTGRRGLLIRDRGGRKSLTAGAPPTDKCCDDDEPELPSGDEDKTLTSLSAPAFRGQRIETVLHTVTPWVRRIRCVFGRCLNVMFRPLNRTIYKIEGTYE